MYISCLVSNSEKGFCYIIDYFQVKEEIKYVEDLKKKKQKQLHDSSFQTKPIVVF